MIVVQQHCGGHFTPIYYPRKNLSVYLGQQARSLWGVEGLDEVTFDFDSQFEFYIPFRTRIPKYLKTKYELIVNKELKYTLLIIPSVSLKFVYTDDTLNELMKDPHSVVWKDLISAPAKLERELLILLERVSNKTFKKKATNKKKRGRPRKYNKTTKRKNK